MTDVGKNSGVLAVAAELSAAGMTSLVVLAMSSTVAVQALAVGMSSWSWRWRGMPGRCCCFVAVCEVRE